VRVEAERSAELQHALRRIQTRLPEPDEPYAPRGPWTGTSRTRQPSDEPETGVPVERLAAVGERLGIAPPGFSVHPKLARLLERRRKAVAEGAPIDWALAEALAFGTLVAEGTPVRLSGQDSCRGTFNQRHAVLVDQASGDEFAPLDHLAATQARFEVYDSQLSEAAVLGFEYGFSLADPSTLVLWEAQFGDFANGAQVVIDQFIAAAHAKWQRMSALVLLLPHGYEGQGPEHSSARVERFLQLCAQDNLQVANCTTPAQYFHLLRRQIRRRFRAPLVVLTPKSLLRDPRAASTAAELASGRFQPVLDDPALAPRAARRVLLASGKVYYDLLERREARAAARGGARDVALVRIEELYPFPEEAIAAALERQPGAEVVWVQEEPANMGAWGFVAERLRAQLPPAARLRYAGRAASASPAVGSGRLHRAEQAALVDAAFGDLD
jgi:2-oxoglutarate dehydrogenase E1 component